MTAEVLVVDAQAGAADDFARLRKRVTLLETLPTADPKTALDAVRTQAIKVAILDQKLDNRNPEKGTELWKLIQAIDGRIKALLLTGQADFGDAADARQLGFSDLLHKSRVRELPERVLLLYGRYQAELAEKIRRVQRSVCWNIGPARWEWDRKLDTHLSLLV